MIDDFMMTDCTDNQMDCNGQDTVFEQRQAEPYTFPELREVLNECRRYIPDEKLKQAIATSPRLRRKVAALDKLERVFVELLKDFRKLDVRLDWIWDCKVGGVVSVIEIPLLPVMRLLGVDLPEQIEETDYCEALEEFCETFDICADPYLAGNGYYVSSDGISTIIRATNLPGCVHSHLCDWAR